MKLLFLDIDGVLNTNPQRIKNGINFIDDNLTRRIADVVWKTGCKVVLSSTWRCQWSDFQEARSHLHRHGITIFGTTPVSIWTRTSNRADEILSFLESFDNVDSFAVLDDVVHNFINRPEFNHRVVMTNDWGKDGGIQPEHVHQLKQILGVLS